MKSLYARISAVASTSRLVRALWIEILANVLKSEYGDVEARESLVD